MKNQFADLILKVQLKIYNVFFDHPKMTMSPDLMLQHNKSNLSLQQNEEVKKDNNINSDSVSNRYPGLRFISSLYRSLSWIVALLTIVVFIYSIIQDRGGIYLGIGALVGGGILFITLLAIAEGIIVFVDIEHNTRMSAKNNEKKS